VALQFQRYNLKKGIKHRLLMLLYVMLLLAL